MLWVFKEFLLVKTWLSPGTSIYASWSRSSCRTQHRGRYELLNLKSTPNWTFCEDLFGDHIMKLQTHNFFAITATFISKMTYVLQISDLQNQWHLNVRKLLKVYDQVVMSLFPKGQNVIPEFIYQILVYFFNSLGYIEVRWVQLLHR